VVLGTPFSSRERSDVARRAATRPDFVAGIDTFPVCHRLRVVRHDGDGYDPAAS